MRGSPLYLLSTALLVLGVLTLLSVAGLYLYGEYERYQYDRILAEQTPSPVVEVEPTSTPEIPTATPEPTVTPTSTAVSTPTGTVEPTATATPTIVTTPTPEPTPTTTPVRVNAPAQRILIEKIKLDTPVVESIIKNGEWVVPRFAAGHLQGTSQPGVPGNAAYAGHVSSISAGNVFANLDKLANDDTITVVTSVGELNYKVTKKHVVRNTDLSVTNNYGDERITLITCTGTWLPLQRDYTHRLIIVATRVN